MIAPDDPRHGTRAGYIAGCRCQPCTSAHTRYMKRYKVDVATRGHRNTPVAPVLAHINTLRANGMSAAAIAAAAGLPATTITNMLAFQRQAGVRHATARAILAVEYDPHPADTDHAHYVPAVGITRRLQALYALGYTRDALAAECRTSDRTIRMLYTGTSRRLTSTVAQGVLDAYARLSMTPPAPQTTQQRVAVERAKRRAAALKWAPPLAWDDDTIDDPLAEPDWSVVAQGARAARADLDEFAHLIRGGESIARAATRLGVTLSAIEQAARRAGRTDITELVSAERHHQRKAAA